MKTNKTTNHITHLFTSLSHCESHPCTPSCLNILTYIFLFWKITNSYNFYPIQTQQYIMQTIWNFRNKTAACVKLQKLCIYIQIKDD